MKKLILLLSLSLSFLALAKEKHLFILSGQSNMAALKPEADFTPAVEKALGKENVIVIKSAQGGQPIKRWVKNWEDPTGTKEEKSGDLYEVLMKELKTKTTDDKFASVSFIWMQGESDAKNSWGKVYKKSFETLITQLKTDLKVDNINVVIGRISDFDLENKKYPHWTVVRESQEKLVEENKNYRLVDTDDLNNKTNKNGSANNDLHYTGEGYKLLGQRFAKNALELIDSNSKK